MMTVTDIKKVLKHPHMRLIYDIDVTTDTRVDSIVQFLENFVPVKMDKMNWSIIGVNSFGGIYAAWNHQGCYHVVYFGADSGMGVIASTVEEFFSAVLTGKATIQEHQPADQATSDSEGTEEETKTEKKSYGEGLSPIKKQSGIVFVDADGPSEKDFELKQLTQWANKNKFLKELTETATTFGVSPSEEFDQKQLAKVRADFVGYIVSTGLPLDDYWPWFESSE